jgi:hypothetical protein
MTCQHWQPQKTNLQGFNSLLESRQADILLAVSGITTHLLHEL